MEDHFWEQVYPCDNCEDSGICDGWESRYCCELCWYLSEDNEPDCSECDPSNI